MSRESHLPQGILTASTDYPTQLKRVYINRLRGEAYVGNYVEYDSRHCHNLRPALRVNGIGRIQGIISENGGSGGGELLLQRYACGDNLPEGCLQQLPIVQHIHIRHMPEIVELNETVELEAQCIKKFVFVIPATEITDTNSYTHLQGMRDYYIIRFYYSNTTKR